MTRLGLIGGHAAAHVAEADECDFGQVRSSNGVHSSFDGSGAKMSSSMASVTPRRVSGDHFGALSLSMITARTPSRKSWRNETRAPIRYSIAMFSVNEVRVLPMRSWRKATFRVCGDLVFRM